MDQALHYLDTLFLDDPLPHLLLVGTYNPWLVSLSIFVAIFASCMALQVAGMARASQSRLHRHIAIASGSVALGGGIWSMHFIGMLAFELCTRVEYAPMLTILSLLPSLGASWIALQLLSRGDITRWQLVLGGVLVGAGIGTMHYSGMAAMRMAPLLRYDPWGFALSIVVAVVLAVLALWIRFGLKRWRLPGGWTIALSGIVMGVAISGMHYCGMAAARFIGDSGTASAQAASQTTFIALGVSFTTVVLTILVGGANGFIRYRELFRKMQSDESRLRAIVDTAVDGIVTLDDSGIVRGFNKSAERLFGWRTDEVIGKSFGMLMPETERLKYAGFLQHYQATGETTLLGVGREAMGLRKDGSLMPMRLALGRAVLPGQLLFVGFITDISERKAMVQALRESEQQYRSLIRNIPGVSFRSLLDDDWTMLFVSDAITVLSGWEPQDFLERRKCLAELMHPDDRARVRQEIEQTISEGRNYVVEYRIAHRDGRELWVWESGGAIRDQQGKTQWIDGVILDISERRKMEEELRAEKNRAELAAAAKTTFLANMSHEIRTPMNAILGFTELLLDSPLEETQRRHLGTVRSSARSLLGLLNDILDTAKLERGAVELELMNFSLREVVTQVSDALCLAARAKGLELTVDYHPAMGEFFSGDPLRIRQILTNLIGNAIKFTERGSVRIEVLQDAGQIHVAVHDTGIGIPSDRLEKIFDPFAQADASMSRRFGGTGLGTTIARQLVELMGGRIYVESQLGIGSVFHVLLPLKAGHAVAAKREAAQLRLPPLRILVADDIEQNIELLSLTLGNAGHKVVATRDGAEAVQVFKSQDFDVILMDVQMPGVDGLEATRRIRAHEREHALKQTPIIALTASVLDQDRQAARAAGMDGFASKPLELHQLNAEIARVLGIAGGTQSEPTVGDDAAYIDWPRGIALWGSEANLSQALRRFLDEHANAFQELESEEHEASTQFAHRIRGAAGNLCLPVMHKLAGQLEDALKVNDTSAIALVPLLSAAFEKTRSELDAFQQPGNPVPESGKHLERDALKPMMQSAIDALERGELEESTLRQLSATLRADGHAKRVDEIEIAVNDFEFDRAAALLRELQTDQIVDGAR